jgi:hypothetical protein
MTLTMPLPTVNVRQTHPTPRKYLELTQDVIVFCLCVMLLVTMGIKLSHLARLLIEGTDFSLVVGDMFDLDLPQGTTGFGGENVRGRDLCDIARGDSYRRPAHRMGKIVGGVRVHHNPRHGAAPCRDPIGQRGNIR